MLLAYRRGENANDEEEVDRGGVALLNPLMLLLPPPLLSPPLPLPLPLPLPPLLLLLPVHSEPASGLMGHAPT